MNKHLTPALPDTEKVKVSLELMQAIAHPLRLNILNLIDRHQEINVGDIYKALKIEQALASQQLRILRTTGLVETRREQKFVYYRLNYPRIQLACTLSKPLASMVSTDAEE